MASKIVIRFVCERKYYHFPVLFHLLLFVGQVNAVCEKKIGEKLLPRFLRQYTLEAPASHIPHFPCPSFAWTTGGGMDSADFAPPRNGETDTVNLLILHATYLFILLFVVTPLDSYHSWLICAGFYFLFVLSKSNNNDHFLCSPGVYCLLFEESVESRLLFILLGIFFGFGSE